MTGNTKLKQAFLLFIIFCSASFAQGNAKFKVVLDAGHGGKDFGNIYNGFVEKNIVLNVALKVGKLLEAEGGTEVVYTRRTDAFIDLAERPAIANRASADIFVSLHCNAESKKVVFGTETYVIGTTKNASNLEVAKKENAVLTLEKDFKTRYDGFNAAAPDVIAGSSALQEPLLTKSIDLASKIQESLVAAKRKNRGVKQGPFWILNKAAMPAVLIELGFLSAQDEGVYVNSDSGQDELAKAIAKAIIAYKKEFFVPGTASSAPVAEQAQPVAVKPAVAKPTAADSAVKPAKTQSPVAVQSPGNIVFKIQIAASGKDLELIPANFNGLNNITKDNSAAVIKYFYGSAAQYADAKELLAQAKEKGYTSAFVVAFKDGQKISVQDALKK